MTTSPPVMCKAGQAYQYVVLGDGTAAIRDQDGNCIGYIEAHPARLKGCFGWTCRLSEDCEFPLVTPKQGYAGGLFSWRTEEKRLEGIALADYELARKGR